MATWLATSRVFPPPTSTLGRSWSLPSHAPQTRRSCVLTQNPCTSAVLHEVPRGMEFKVTPEHFRTLILERLRLPLQTMDAHECGALLDVQGRHRAVCPRSGRLRSRAVGFERTLARVCREAGATVRCNVRLRDMNVAVSATDTRSIEVLATGLPLHHGAQLAVDITLRSALTSASHACPCGHC